MLFDLVGFAIGILFSARAIHVYGNSLSEADVDKIIYKLQNLQQNGRLLKHIDKYKASNTHNKLNRNQFIVNDNINRKEILKELNKRLENNYNVHHDVPNKYSFSPLGGYGKVSNNDGARNHKLFDNVSRLDKNRIKYKSRINNIHDLLKLGDENNYSKIYLVFFPNEAGDGESKKEMKKLLSQIRSLNMNHRSDLSSNKRFKNNLSGQSLRKLAGKYELDSVEQYKAKRSRSSDKGAIGRTSIPYMGRGDIYERDHE